MEINMFFKKRETRKTHPYAGLAIFTLAAVGLIGITRRSKEFIKEKTQCVMNFFKHRGGCEDE